MCFQFEEYVEHQGCYLRPQPAPPASDTDAARPDQAEAETSAIPERLQAWNFWRLFLSGQEAQQDEAGQAAPLTTTPELPASTLRLPRHQIRYVGYVQCSPAARAAAPDGQIFQQVSSGNIVCCRTKALSLAPYGAAEIASRGVSQLQDHVTCPACADMERVQEAAQLQVTVVSGHCLNFYLVSFP